MVKETPVKNNMGIFKGPIIKDKKKEYTLRNQDLWPEQPSGSELQESRSGSMPGSFVEAILVR